MSNRADWQKNMGISFHNPALLQQALTHSSCANESSNFTSLTGSDNERLEFLGDSVLGMVVTEMLYHEFSDLPEGKLTMIRARLICQETLSSIAASLDLGSYLIMGQGEAKGNGRTRISNLANALEAIIGALYLDQGLCQVKQFILKQLEPLSREIRAGHIPPDYKSWLQEYTQHNKQSTPSYRMVEARGPDHDKSFTVEVFVDQEMMGRGLGSSKKRAETAAAKSAWMKLR
ncbi:MAG: ribonuclease III [Chloroflexota bacterium]|nr:ribonuclease III [Chloroflexota bacterium]